MVIGHGDCIVTETFLCITIDQIYEYIFRSELSLTILYS